MKALTLVISLLCFPLGLSVAQAKEVKIIDFLMDEVEICDNDYNCQDVPAKTLPDPTKSPIPVVAFDENEGMLKFVVKDEEKWIHQTEVELNQKALASVICTDQKISRKSDKEVFATYGLGEGC
ncbi:hypothetical protein RN22_08900 [Grimontia sp. AD028]|uniref:hypothetical protein n=1 Tax=Grimontia sp. AD028 TaxID=1581149 RepID=UPI00061AC83D|nr:hypothetical protein [Grimontia sp. AD028]KKD60849.1 hypothetical protein RN22_08900 [Grimontia sp. AD028]